jgi:hypothetical protein
MFGGDAELRWPGLYLVVNPLSVTVLQRCSYTTMSDVRSDDSSSVRIIVFKGMLRFHDSVRRENLVVNYESIN